MDDTLNDSTVFDPLRLAVELGIDEDTVINESSGLDPLPLAIELSIDEDDADTVLKDVLPILKRKLVLIAAESGSSTMDVHRAKKLIIDEVPQVLASYALTDLRNNPSFLIFLVKQLFGLTDQRAQKLIDIITRKSTPVLAEQLASQLGIHPTKVQIFIENVIPKIRNYSKSMLRKKLETERSIEEPDKYYQFIVDNVFIDEFENHPYIRSTTDATNRAVLQPEALKTAFQLLGNWTKEVFAETR